MDFDTNSSFGTETLTTFLNNFDDLNLISENYTEFLLPYFEAISKDNKLRRLAKKKCKNYFERWVSTNDKEISTRYQEFWFILNGTFYELEGNLFHNLIINEVDIKEYENVLNNQAKKEFEPDTGKPLPNPLNNLILEEVEVTDYVDAS
ncbi:Swm2p NDAI_0D01180 [Naumovozyma dairenensis CBS 421]|uniref:Nucleolar protein SWM2 n=1 Tax=Naumovozyma dairenensis (strain ATCC 10597 / BCRC 20456 / CBS 421 / NBRC 0211 / NRRL Y-12639) TaxID=1071378 RepID=G0W9H0_NAUDC|nr:hypothetical protein NDAI_0D01180 [Naumovozyma dairenensis CBS 421]CCD24431.1 hypothetical protein NDAI_0D01180 [Naumovozyma dairenensis CBS 421]